MTFSEDNIAEIYLKYSVDDYASMTPAQFEGFIAFILRFKYDKTEVVGASGDFGCDVLCQEKNGDKTAVQVKRYALDNKVNNSVVNEVLGGMSYYGASKGIVITSGKVLDSAYKLANKDGRVEIWDNQMLDSFIRGALHDKLSEISSKEVDKEDEVLKISSITSVTYSELLKQKGHSAYFIEYVIENTSSESIHVIQSIGTIIVNGFRASYDGWGNYDSNITLQAGEKAKQGIVVDESKVDSNLVESSFEVSIKYNVTRRGHIRDTIELKAQKSFSGGSKSSNSDYNDGPGCLAIAIGIFFIFIVLAILFVGLE